MLEPQPTHNTDVSEESAASADEAQSPPIECATNADEAARASTEADEPPSDSHAIQQMLRPIVQGIEALARAQFEQSNALDRVEKVMLGQESLPRMLTETKQALDQRNSVSRSMFEALHSELKSYKDGFLMESMLRPVIRDLISIYDDIAEIHRQLMLTLASHEKRGDLSGGALILFENVLSPASQLEHNCDSVIEVLERLEVTRIPSNTGKLDKRTQRAVNIEAAEDPEQDQQIAKVVRRGFQWKDRIIRPEEVVIKKWKDACLAAHGSNSDTPPLKQKSA